MADEHTCGLRVKPQTQEVPGRLPEDISAALDTEGPMNPRAPRPLLPWLLQEALSRCPAEGRQPRRLRTEHRVAGRPARLTEHGAPACTSFSGSFPQVPLPRSTADCAAARHRHLGFGFLPGVPWEPPTWTGRAPSSHPRPRAPGEPASLTSAHARTGTPASTRAHRNPAPGARLDASHGRHSSWAESQVLRARDPAQQISLPA
ncbi:uncharacterized protein LOC123943225 isoform X6 [Meles meles]|uniref:uncharacterized protein LOC123943225 isoform X6 n=1 Tax=Meles meles TaxID=9662 RepID=UPI001E698476|nr:uncharacterized protein LOC123943225 isoform X6 [Meles meles]